MNTIELPSSLATEAQEIRALLSGMSNNRLANLLLSALGPLESGHNLVIRPSADALVSPQEAARRTGLSRPFICKLLDNGVIPEQPRVGSHRKIRVRDLEEFMENRNRASNQFAADLSRANEANKQLVRDIAGVSAENASKFGY